MLVGDVTREGRRSWFRLSEKGGREHRVPAHHTAEALVDAWLAGSGLEGQRHRLLFPTLSGRGAAATLTGEALMRQAAAQMVKRRARVAGLPETITNHSFRGTGITEYLRAGGTLETAARIAGHASTSTTQLYDRTDEAITLDEIERIHIRDPPAYEGARAMHGRTRVGHEPGGADRCAGHGGQSSIGATGESDLSRGVV